MRGKTGATPPRICRPVSERTGGRAPEKLGDGFCLETLDETVLISQYLAPYTGKTLERYYQIMLDFLGWCINARIHMLDVNRVFIEQYAAAKRKSGLSKSTVSGYLVPICGFYRWAFQEGLTVTDHGAYVRRYSRPRRSRLKWYTREEAKRILAASIEMGKPTSGLIHLLLLNGLRLGETLAARIEHLSTIDEMTALTLPNRKMGVMDTVTLPAATVEVLSDCIGKRKRGRILLDRGRVLTPARVYTLCNQMSTICGLDTPVRPHQLRATFVTLSLDAGVPYRDVMASTGHADMSMVAYYDRAHAAIRRNASHRLSDWLKD
ncbi:tyrosine-type recombinase/integrase [Varibaculum cambriense]|uniref:Integrase n=1 Tax=Varibaculum cambriense TaxID=184870 RepID=A0ABX4UNM1_9ACTO|nr:tyrosine-type recombinase/integrase [Varibaculum cambriense]PMB89291.1 hypothetical protein CJ240_05860 [Varibaculum cambriense]